MRFSPCAVPQPVNRLFVRLRRINPHNVPQLPYVNRRISKYLARCFIPRSNQPIRRNRRFNKMGIFINSLPLIPMHSRINVLSQGLILIDFDLYNQFSRVHLPPPFSGIFGYVGLPFLLYRICHHKEMTKIQHRRQKSPTST